MKSPLSQQSSPNFWDHIDAVLVINLDEREDRWKSFQERIGFQIPESKLHRIPAIYGKHLPGYGERPWFRGKKRDSTWAARGGCILSHRAACLAAQNAGWDTVLIFEDDVVTSDDFVQVVQELPQLLWSPESAWDVCYLGYTEPERPFHQMIQLETCELIRFSGCNAAHAYLLKADARDWIISHLPEQGSIWKWTSRFRAVDRWYRRNLSRRFVVTALGDSIFNQAYGFSDIECRQKSSLDELCTTRIQKPCSSQAGFALKLRAKNTFHRICGGYDFLRAVQKRIKGF